MVLFVIKSSVVAILMLMVSAMEIEAQPCSYPAMFVFGDSLSDTGNAVVMGNPDSVYATMLPYGETYPGWADNRFSDGRLIVDYLATYLGLPFLNPYCNTTSNFTTGVNYSVVGATALNTSYLNSLNIFPASEWYVEEQLIWHLTLKGEVENTSETQAGRPSLASFSNGLYVISIGGNDYVNALNSSDLSMSYINETFIPIVVQKLRQVMETLYFNGARNFLIFDTQAFGCCSRNLREHFLATRDSDGCMQDHTIVAHSHGVLLLSEVESLRRLYRDATFLFADYNGAHIHILRNREIFGFTNALDACCGAGPQFPYSYDYTNRCSSRAFVCDNPNSYIIWDGVHSTDRFNSRVSYQIFNNGSYLNPSNGLITCSDVNISNDMRQKETTTSLM